MSSSDGGAVAKGRHASHTKDLAKDEHQDYRQLSFTWDCRPCDERTQSSISRGIARLRHRLPFVARNMLWLVESRSVAARRKGDGFLTEKLLRPSFLPLPFYFIHPFLFLNKHQFGLHCFYTFIKHIQ